MIYPNQLSSREVLDVIIQRTIIIYRYAVIVSFAFVGIGLLLFLASSDQDVDTAMPHPVTLAQQVLRLEASGFFGVGIGVMILTPIVMIAGAAITFRNFGDIRYALITAAVGVILGLSIVFSFALG